METEIIKAANDAAHAGNYAFAICLVLCAILFWYLRNQLIEIRLLRRQVNDQMRLHIAQIIGRQLGNEEIAKAIIDQVQANLGQYDK